MQKYGDSLFHMLNQGMLNPSMFRGLTAPVPKAKTKKGFATGGNVPVSTSSSSRGYAMSVQFFDEQVMDRAMAAGDQSVLRFARKRRSAYRAALGLEAGS